MREPTILEMQPPTDHIERIEFLAKALAYGAVHDLWSPRISVSPLYRSTPSDDMGGYTSALLGEEWKSKGHPNYEQRLKKYLDDIWMSQQPQLSFLESFGFFSQSGGAYNTNPSVAAPLYATDYLLTPKAFELLEKPAKKPKVFIAYGTEESSPFALAIEYRLMSLGVPVFIDRNIPLGDEWDDLLQLKIQESEYMLCLLAPSTLKRSTYVCKEIALARTMKEARQYHFISIQHGGFVLKDHFGTCDESLQTFIGNQQAVIVKSASTSGPYRENAKSLHDAVEDIINRFGFWTPIPGLIK